MTAPVRTIAAKFTAQGSDVVQAALAKVTAAAQSATQKIAQASQVQAQGWQRSVEAAQRSAYAEQGLRERSTQQALQAAARVAQSSVASATATSKAVSDKYGTVALSVASSFNQMAFAGKITGEGIRNVLVQTATVAASVFGVGGPVVAAIAVAALTMTNLFRGARAERDKLEQEAIAGWNRMVDAGDLTGLKKQAQTQWQGTASKEFKDGLGPRLGALGLPMADMAELTEALAAADRLARVRVAGMATRAEEIRQVMVLRQQYDDLFKTIVSANNAPQTSPTAAAITTTASRTTRAPRFAGAPFVPRDRDRFASAALDARVDASLGLVGGRGVIQPLGGPKKFAAQLTADLAETLKQIKIPPATEIRERLLEGFRKEQSAISIGISDTIAGGIAAGIAVAITSGSIADALQSLGQTVLASLGNIFAEIAAKAIMQATLMVKFMAFLTANPVVALAAAAAMMVLARSMGGSRSGAGGSSGSGSGSYAGAAAAASSDSVTRLVFGNNSITTAAGMTPRTATHITVIGPSDPVAQRQIYELVSNAARRGMTVKG